MDAEVRAKVEQVQQEIQAKKERILSEKNVDEQTLIKSIRGKYNLREDEVERNLLKILEIEEKQEKCKTCTGLDNCLNGMNGYYNVIHRNTGLGVEGHFYVGACACRYELQRREQAKWPARESG